MINALCVSEVLCVDVGLLHLYRIYFSRRQRWQKNTHSVRKETYGYLCKEDTLVKVTVLNIIQFYIYISTQLYDTTMAPLQATTTMVIDELFLTSFATFKQTPCFYNVRS